MPSYETGVDIAATRDEVWRALLHAGLLGRRRRSSQAGESRSAAAIRGPHESFTVAESDAESRLVLVQGWPAGLYTVRRSILLGDSEQGVRVELVQEFHGPLAAVLGRTASDPDAGDGRIRGRAEAGGGSRGGRLTAGREVALTAGMLGALSGLGLGSFDAVGLAAMPVLLSQPRGCGAPTPSWPARWWR